MLELETGGVDIAHLGRSDIARVENHPDLNLYLESNYQKLYFGINTERVADLRIRQAINYAINTAEIHQTIMYGVGDLLTGPLNETVFGAIGNINRFPFDKERALELLAEACYGPDNRLALTMLVQDIPERGEWAVVAQAHLAQIGIDLSISVTEQATFLSETAAGNYDMFVLAWTAVTADADYGLFPLFHSSSIGAPGNRTFFNNPEVDRLLELARASFDPEVRLQAYHDAQMIIVEESPMVFIATGVVLMGARNNIGGLRLLPDNHTLYYEVYFTND